MAESSCSCGVLLYDPEAETLLLGHSTGNKHWDIPKGVQEPGETPIETALRELAEETGITLSGADLLDLGAHDYRPGKRLHLFLHRLPISLTPTTLVCASTFLFKGEPKPELDSFANVPVRSLSQYVTPRMLYAISRVLANA